MEVDVVFVLTGDIRYNSRALKQLALLSESGYRVLAVGIGTPSVQQWDERITIRTLNRPAGSGPPFFWRWHRTVAAIVAAQPAQVYHASDLYCLPALARAARQCKAALVFDARERYPYVAATRGRPWVRLFWEAVESSYIRQADAVFTVSESIASHLSASYNIDLPEVLYNVPPEREKVASDVLRQELGLPADKPIVLHQGKIQKDRGCMLLTHAMQDVQGAVLVFLGDGPLLPAIAAEVQRLSLENKVKFRPPVPPDVLHQYTCSADIGVTLLEDTCLNHRYALPNKLFEYLVAGLPVLGSDLPEIGHIVKAYGVGRVVCPEKPAEIARVLQEMVDQPGRREKWAAAAPAVLETFNWDIASQIFLQRYKSLYRL